MRPLVRCFECDSPLLQLERAWMLADGRHVAERRCPECGRRDCVSASQKAILAWRERERRLLLELGGGSTPAVPV
jgi:hypothetical protein